MLKKRSVFVLVAAFFITVSLTTLVETYELPGGRQLIVTVRADVHGQQMSVRRVYDPVRK